MDNNRSLARTHKQMFYDLTDQGPQECLICLVNGIHSPLFGYMGRRPTINYFAEYAVSNSMSQVSCLGTDKTFL